MRFALLGDHPDGQAMAAALVAAGRHEVSSHGAADDAEEVFADPAVEAVIVAGRPDARPAQLRRALQSERHVLCVYPPDPTPELAYEADMMRQDSGRVLLPLLPGASHPAIRRLADFVRVGKGTDAAAPVGALRLLEMVQIADGPADGKTTFPGWELLRGLNGEIAEVSAFAAGEHASPGEPVLVAGRFELGGLFQAVFLPAGPEVEERLTVVGDRGRAELVFPVGRRGPAFLDWRDESGDLREESWEVWDPWPAMVERFEAAVAGAPGSPSWLDAVRGLELDDAARRGVERRRSSVLEYQEASEEVGFKGTMTLVGCGLIWLVLLLLLTSYWYPPIRWLIAGLLVVFLGLQFLRFLIPKQKK